MPCLVRHPHLHGVFAQFSKRPPLCPTDGPEPPWCQVDGFSGLDTLLPGWNDDRAHDREEDIF